MLKEAEWLREKKNTRAQKSVHTTEMHLSAFTVVNFNIHVFNKPPAQTPAENTLTNLGGSIRAQDTGNLVYVRRFRDMNP